MDRKTISGEYIREDGKKPKVSDNCSSIDATLLAIMIKKCDISANHPRKTPIVRKIVS